MVTEAGRASAKDIAAGLAVAETRRTVEALLTDSSGGAANDTIVAVAGSGADAAINDNFADLAAKVNVLLQHFHDRQVMDAS